jgi:hypothetical protein
VVESKQEISNEPEMLYSLVLISLILHIQVYKSGEMKEHTIGELFGKEDGDEKCIQNFT